MKKMYKAPATVVIVTRLQTMIAGSDGRTVSPNTVSGANQLSRERGWDDEEDW